MMTNVRFVLLTAGAVVLTVLGACDDKAKPAPTMTKPPAAAVGGQRGAGAAKPADASAASKAHDHDHDHDHDHGHGPTTQLGEQQVGGFTVKASRDGDVTPGGDMPVDVWVTGGAVKVSVVRLWIGTQDAKGSMKARAELEKDNWHTHADVPKPMPEGSKLWVEFETDKGDKHLAGFDLNN
ncbi:MAG: hypothetical protein ACK4WH_03645 [Phycisphaerales bacterium]